MLDTFQKRTILSSPHDTSSLPAAWKRTSPTAPPWLRYWCTVRLRSTSHNRIVSEEKVANELGSAGFTAIDRMVALSVCHHHRHPMSRRPPHNSSSATTRSKRVRPEMEATRSAGAASCSRLLSVDPPPVPVSALQPEVDSI